LDGRSDWTDRLKCLLAEMLIRAISSVVERLPYKEEVAGSNPASPTKKKRHFAGKTPRIMIGVRMFQASHHSSVLSSRS
jgi:hypothetical protein